MNHNDVTEVQTLAIRCVKLALAATIEFHIDEALERAAQICDSVNNHDNPMTSQDCADAIRALKVSNNEFEEAL